MSVHMSVAKHSLVVAGLPVTVYSERASAEKKGPVAILFFLHGRNGSAKSIEWVAEDTIKHIEHKRKHDKAALDMIIVTFVSTAHSLLAALQTLLILDHRTSETMVKDSLMRKLTGRGRKAIILDMRKPKVRLI